MKIINASINLSKIPKDKITKSKSGESWVNVTIIAKDEKDQFDKDTSIQLSQTKEERESKQPILYLGNGKTAWEKVSENKPPQNTPKSEEKTDDIPF